MIYAQAPETLARLFPQKRRPKRTPKNRIAQLVQPLSQTLAATLAKEPLNWNPEAVELSRQLAHQVETMTGLPGAWDPMPVLTGFLPGYNHSRFAHFGQREEPWFTGAGTDGLTFRHLWTEFEAAITDRMILANFLARPIFYDIANTEPRRGGYGDGMRPYSSVLQGQDWGNGVQVYGHDYEHVVIQCLVDLANREVEQGVQIQFSVPPGIVQLNSVEMARALAMWARKAVCGQMRAPWSASNRPSDRVAGRLLYAMLRLLPITGLDGEDEVAFWNFLDLCLGEWEKKGPWQMQPPDNRGKGCIPPVEAPYWNPVHSYSYVGCTLFWILETGDPKLQEKNRAGRIQALLPQWFQHAVDLTGMDGSYPWAIQANPVVVGYMSSSPGVVAPYAPSPEVYTLMRIAASTGIPTAAAKAQAIYALFGPTGTMDQANKNWAKAWLADEKGNSVLA